MYDVTQDPSTGTPVSYTSPMYVSIPLGILTAPKDTKRSIKRIKRIKAELDDDVVDLTMVAPDPPKLLDPSLRGTVIDLTLDDYHFSCLFGCLHLDLHNLEIIHMYHQSDQHSVAVFLYYTNDYSALRDTAADKRRTLSHTIHIDCEYSEVAENIVSRL